MATTRRKLKPQELSVTVAPAAKKPGPEDVIRKHRKEIDRIDGEIIHLIHRRVEEVLQIGELKGGSGAAVYRPEREKEIFKRILDQNRKSPFPDQVLTHLFREIISACRGLEAPLRVAYFGPSGTYTHQAAVESFGSSADLSPCRTIGDVFDEVEEGRARYGVVPVENSTEGIVPGTLDAFIHHRLSIVNESLLEIHHCLLTVEKDLSSIRKVLSHPQPFGQCRAWLRRHLPQAELVEASSTAAAAKLAAGKKGFAAIASARAAEETGLPILQKNIEDIENNVTRFVILSKSGRPEPTGDDKTSLLFSIPDEPGALGGILTSLAARKLNLSQIVSRPGRRKAFEYHFFIDLDGHVDQAPFPEALADLEKRTTSLRILGSFPKSRPFRRRG